MNVLIVVGGGMVETLQATPLLRTLEAGLPDAHITVACPASARALAHGIPGVDAVVPLRALDARGGLGSFGAALVALRRRRFEVALVCSDRLRERVLVYLAAVPRRVGTGGGPGALLLTDRCAPDDTLNRCASWLALAHPLGVEHVLSQPLFDPGDAARRAAEAWLLGEGFENGRLLVAMAPGTGFADPPAGMARHALAWDPQRFAFLANHLAERHGARIVVVGTMHDRPLAEEMLLDLDAPGLDLCGHAGVVEVAAVLERCDLLISTDSPLLHLAAAVGTPSLGLFGPTDGRVRAPYGTQHRVVQGLADDSAGLRGRRTLPSMQRIRVDDVLAGIEAAL